MKLFGSLRELRLTSTDGPSTRPPDISEADFVALDVETANPDLSSICQIGTVAFRNDTIVSAWQSYVDPEDYFDGFNVHIHGITEEMVAGAPTFADVFPSLSGVLKGHVVACHSRFDRVAFSRAAAKYGLSTIDCRWLDTARVARRAWTQFAARGSGLANVADTLGIVFRHHDAREDARAAGQILARAITETGLSVDDWLVRAEQPISSRSALITREGNADGHLAGEVAVFTGALTIPRREAADMAADAGCRVATSVSSSTTLLVVGEQDIRRLEGHQKSSKHRKAEELIAQGRPIRILGEGDFQRLISM